MKEIKGGGQVTTRAQSETNPMGSMRTQLEPAISAEGIPVAPNEVVRQANVQLARSVEVRDLVAVQEERGESRPWGCYRNDARDAGDHIMESSDEAGAEAEGPSRKTRQGGTRWNGLSLHAA